MSASSAKARILWGFDAVRGRNARLARAMPTAAKIVLMLTFNQQVMGSSPIALTMKIKDLLISPLPTPHFGGFFGGRLITVRTIPGAFRPRFVPEIVGRFCNSLR